MNKPQSATPLYERGSRVLYVDHHGRQQCGEVQRVEANWPSWGDPGDPPFIYYTVSHPSYRNRRILIGSRDIAGVPMTAPSNANTSGLEVERKAELYDHMKLVAEANGFESLTEAIAIASSAQAKIAELSERLEASEAMFRLQCGAASRRPDR